MSQGVKGTITTRIISTLFTVLAIAVFKPFGLEAWQWMGYIHLLAIGALGLGCCMVTEGILKYIIKKPRSYNQGVDYIIKRNLRFQLINTPLVALVICLYRHFVMSDKVAGNMLSWSNFFETLVIIAFCSFAIGLFWRFKFRSRFLAAELEETRLLNEGLKQLQEKTNSAPRLPNRPWLLGLMTLNQIQTTPHKTRRPSRSRERPARRSRFMFPTCCISRQWATM